MRAKFLIITSFILFAVTGGIVARYGQQVYFVAFHRPFHTPFANTSKKYTPAVLPKLQVQSSISDHKLTPGDKQHITVKVTPDKTLTGYAEVWILSPEHKQVFRSSMDGDPTKFIAGKSRTITYSYTLPANAKPGVYHASAIITSPNSQTDYYVNTNFTTFTVSP